MKKIIFVCTGNTCRSIMAEALARNILEKQWNDEHGLQVFSAGIAALPGMPASPEAVEVLSEMGIDLQGHRASVLKPEDVEFADLVLTMTKAHRDFVRQMVPGAEEKVYTLGEYAGTGEEIPDPIGYPLEIYRRCAKVINDLIVKIVDKLKKA